MDRKLRIAIIGCGAVTEIGHLPAAAAAADRVEVTLLVDTERTRAEALAQRFHVPQVAESYEGLNASADAAILALPHALHAPVGLDVLRQDVHVLVEKPMALTTVECDAMIEAAEQRGLVLAVGLIRRFYRSSLFAKAVLDAGLLGKIRSFDIRNGSVASWRAVSDFALRKELAGGGVLINNGPHTLDLLLWWLGDPESCEYFDDNYGGVEADCRIELVMPSGAKGVVELSRTRKVRNTAIIRGERGEMEIWSGENKASLWLADAGMQVTASLLDLQQPPQRDQSLVDLLKLQLLDFAASVLEGTPPAVPGREGRRSVALIQKCYACRKSWDLPWITARCVGPVTQSVGTES